MITSPRSLLRFGLFALTVVTFVLQPAAEARAQQACAIGREFKPLVDLIPAAIGSCLDNPHKNPENGNVEQRTTSGLLVWRAQDNLFGFTNGSTTWLLGPDGLGTRRNTAPPFSWESKSHSLALEH